MNLEQIINISPIKATSLLLELEKTDSDLLLLGNNADAVLYWNKKKVELLDRYSDFIVTENQLLDLYIEVNYTRK